MSNIKNKHKKVVDTMNESNLENVDCMKFTTSLQWHRIKMKTKSQETITRYDKIIIEQVVRTVPYIDRLNCHRTNRQYFQFIC